MFHKAQDDLLLQLLIPYSFDPSPPLSTQAPAMFAPLLMLRFTSTFPASEYLCTYYPYAWATFPPEALLADYLTSFMCLLKCCLPGDYSKTLPSNPSILLLCILFSSIVIPYNVLFLVAVICFLVLECKAL